MKTGIFFCAKDKEKFIPRIALLKDRFDVYVLENNSTDRTVELCKEHNISYRSYKYHVEQGAAFAWAANQCCDWATELDLDYCRIMGADDYPLFRSEELWGLSKKLLSTDRVHVNSETGLVTNFMSACPPIFNSGSLFTVSWELMARSIMVRNMLGSYSSLVIPREVFEDEKVRSPYDMPTRPDLYFMFKAWHKYGMDYLCSVMTQIDERKGSLTELYLHTKEEKKSRAMMVDEAEEMGLSFAPRYFGAMVRQLQ